MDVKVVFQLIYNSSQYFKINSITPVCCKDYNSISKLKNLFFTDWKIHIIKVKIICILLKKNCYHYCFNIMYLLRPKVVKSAVLALFKTFHWKPCSQKVPERHFLWSRGTIELSLNAQVLFSTFMWSSRLTNVQVLNFFSKLWFHLSWPMYIYQPQGVAGNQCNFLYLFQFHSFRKKIH